MPKVLVIQNAHCETLGTIADVLEPIGISVNYIHAFDGEPIPKEMSNALALIILGGPMGVYDCSYYPFFIKRNETN
ncbi:MAG: hypothetical protein QXG01_01565 [Candidatus Bathyarchaeia archaeon]